MLPSWEGLSNEHHEGVVLWMGGGINFITLLASVYRFGIVIFPTKVLVLSPHCTQILR